MKQIKLVILLTVFFGNPFFINAQNINNPNKTGPLGTQVNTISGNLFIPRTDFVISARDFDIDISFFYNSYYFDSSIGFGKGWNFNYNIFYNSDTLDNKIITWGDGREDKYSLQPNSSYKAPKGFFDKLTQYQTNKFLLTTPGGDKYFFDNAAVKKITRMEEPNGNYINFIYTDTLLTSLVNTAGQAISFAYNTTGQLATITDAVAAPARTYSFSYDDNKNLIRVTDPLGGKSAYTYLPNGPMKTLSDKNNNLVDIIYFPDYSLSEIIGCNKRISFSYDTLSRTTTATDHVDGGTNQVTTYKYQKSDNIFWITDISGNCCGYNLKYDYDNNGNMTKMTDANGNISTYTYDSSGNMLTMKDALGQVSTYTYTINYNRISSYKDNKGFLYSLDYDAKANLIQLTTPGNQVFTATYNTNGDIVSSTDPKGNVFTYNYDAYGNPATVTGPNGSNAALAFDARGNLLSFTDALGNSNTAEYDILDRLKKITDPINKSIQLTYDANGNAVTIKNKNNETASLNYDASNRAVKATDPVGNKSYVTYDAMNNVKSVQNAIGNQMKFSYDTRNRLTESKDAEGNTAAYNYDAHGNITSMRMKNGQHLNYTYDQLHRITAASDENGIIAALGYDANSNITSYTNGTGAVSTVVYDSLNRPKLVTDPLGNSSSFTYDKNNNISSATDNNGITSSYTYDGLDRVKTFTNNNGFVTKVDYDLQGNVTKLTDQNNNITLYTYDNLNRRKTMTFPDGKFTEHFYDNKGNVTSMRRTDGSVVNYLYDTINRLTTKTLPDNQVYSYTYDALGRVLTATNNAGVVTFTYDVLNRITSETFDGRTTAYQYNITGRTQTTVYPDGSVIKKEFDGRNRLNSVLKDSIMLAEYTYNNANQPLTKNFANGVTSSMQYDFANRLSNVNTKNGAIQNTSYTYDKMYNKTAITRNNNPALSEQFTYDNGYRLTNYKRGPTGSPVTQNTYTYDAVGNRTAANLNGVNNTYSINNLNQITAITGGTNAALVYDNRGNLTFDGNFYKQYDAENRLIKDSSAPANVIAYTYDAFNRRVVKWTNNDPKKYTYSGAAQIEERDGANVLLNSTVYTNFLSPVMNEKNGNRFYYHQNELNSVEGISNKYGNLAERYQYDGYGKPAIFDSAGNTLTGSITGNRIGFTGQEYDSASGSYRFFFRNYSPTLGTFAQRDLIEYGDGTGMYQYVGNNPANGVDVWGLDDCGEKNRQDIGSKVSFTSEVFGKLLEKAADKELNWKTGKLRETLRESKLNYKNLMEKSIHFRFRGEKGAAAYHSKTAMQSMETARKTEANLAKTTAKVGGANAQALKSVGKGLTLLDNLVKAETFLSSLVDGEGNPQHTQEIQAGGDLALSLLGWTPIGAGYGTVDFIVEKVSGDGITTHTASAGTFLGDASVAYETGRPVKMQWGRPARTDENITTGNIYASLFYDVPYDDLQSGYTEGDCPDQGGTRRPSPRPSSNNGLTATQMILTSYDPNEIIGPQGQTDKKWVSVKDRLPYTILFENSAEATAPAKFVRITTPVEPKEDATTFLLGNFGFNSTTFTVPPNTSVYYNRLDVKDSLGLYVDITAGYDQMNNVAFWEFQAIDPVTLLPPSDPLKGFLLMQDSTKENYGHGFVNFSIKSKITAQTLDTIGARAYIVFDGNDTIPTNIYTNTIDAFAPTSSMTALPLITPDTEVPIHYTGTDDPNGSGVKWYSIYVSVDNGPAQLYLSNFTKRDTTFKALAEHTYKFYLSATDTAGNVEALKLSDSVQITNGEQVICPGGSITFDSKINGSTYQWQVDNGTGYTNVTNGGVYSNATTSVLTLTSAPTSMYGYKYRCLVNGSGYSLEFIVKFGMTWGGTVDTAWEDPANWSCNSLPDANTDVTIFGGKLNYPVVNSNAAVRSLRAMPGIHIYINSGYTLTIVK